ncbi:hypothetical protein Tcan_04966 [Toxocara canis]|uniref:Uncharacterized protein n=1 Tax=Toxocara canis TaxID=6265 RepID=A0A0B2VF96_TOXCA|nr:hypothetical protein Tcan_04966 [Toxocara canis]
MERYASRRPVGRQGGGAFHHYEDFRASRFGNTRSDSNSVDVDNGMKKFGRGGDKRTRVWVNREKGESETESGLYWTRGTHVKRYSQQRKTIEHYGGQA